MVPQGMIFPGKRAVFLDEPIMPQNQTDGQILNENPTPYTTQPTYSTKKYLAGMVLGGLMMAAGLGLVVNQAIKNKPNARTEMATTAMLLTVGGAGYGYSAGRRSYLKNKPIR